MGSELLQAILSFPFKQIGTLLRWLSLSSGVGNIVAWIIYIGICMIPITLLSIKLIKKRFHMFDLMLIIIAVALAIVMYAMINPASTMIQVYLVEGYDEQKAVLGGFIYSMIIGYAVLGLLKKFATGDKFKLCKWINVLLCIVGVILVLDVILAAGDLVESFKTVSKENYNWTQLIVNVLLTNIFLVIRYLVGVTPCITTAIVIIFVINFLKEYDISGVSKETVKKGNMVQKVAVIAIVINVLANVFCNFIQLAFYKLLLDTHANVELPIFSLIFILGMSLVTKLIIVSKEIKEENEMFV